MPQRFLPSLTIVIMLLVASSVARAAVPTKLDHLLQREFPARAQAQGFICSHVSAVYTKGLTERGVLLRVFCDHDQLNYRVLVTPQNRLMIRPWSE